MISLDNRGRKDFIEQGKKRQDLALRFLADEVFTNREILKEVTGIQSNQGIVHFIKRLEKNQLIQEVKLPSVEVPNKFYRIIGITSHGMAMAGYVNRRGFEFSKLKHSQLLHKFLCQQVHLQAIEYNWQFTSHRWLQSKWFGQKGVKRPDAIIIRPDSTKIAVEAERTVKSKYRYQQIIVNYLKMIKHGVIHQIWYVMPNENLMKTVSKSISSIEKVTINNNGEKSTFDVSHFIGKYIIFEKI